jgi:hypothetical protein
MSRDTIETINYKGIDIELYRDWDTQWMYDDIKDNNDGNLLFVVKTRDTKGFGDDRIKEYIEKISKSKQVKNLGYKLYKIIEKLDYSQLEELEKGDKIKEFYNYHYDLDTIWGEYIDEGSMDEFPFIKAVCDMLGIKWEILRLAGYSQGDISYVFQIIDDNYSIHTQDYLEAVFYTGFYGYSMDIETEESDCGGWLEESEAEARAKGLIDIYLEKQEKCEHKNITIRVSATFKAELKESITGLSTKYWINKEKDTRVVTCDDCDKEFEAGELQEVDPKYVDINVPIIKI